MTLENIKLPQIVIGKLYKNCLVDLHDEEKNPIHKDDKITFLGGNNRHILLLVNNFDVPFLPDKQLNFLLGILSACKLNMADIAIVNLNKTGNTEHKNLPEFFKANVVMLFGIEGTVLSLPFKIPDFQVQSFKDKKYLFGPSLEVIEKDNTQKRKLWEALKKIFSI
jgi:hypothetical protein